MVGTCSLWCRSDFDTDLAYEVTKWFDKNYELYKDKGNEIVVEGCSNPLQSRGRRLSVVINTPTVRSWEIY